MGELPVEKVGPVVGAGDNQEPLGVAAARERQRKSGERNDDEGPPCPLSHSQLLLSCQDFSAGARRCTCTSAEARRDRAQPYPSALAAYDLRGGGPRLTSDCLPSARH